MARIHDAELIRVLRTYFPARDEASYAWGNIYSAFRILPKLRTLHFCGNALVSGNIADVSGSGQTLTQANTPTQGLEGLLPFTTYVRASSQEHYRATEASLEITDDLTAWAWVRFTANSTGNLTGVISKYLVAGNQRSWALVKNATNLFRFILSSNGSSAAITLSSSVTYATDQWFFIAGRYDPSTKVSIFVNGVFDDTTTAVPASLFNSTANYRLAAQDTGDFLDGDIAIAGMANFYFTDALIRAMYDKSRRLFGV